MSNQTQRYDAGAIRGAGVGLQTTQDAPIWDQMRARIGGKMEGLQQALGQLQQALGPVLEQTGKNTPRPVGYGEAPTPAPIHDSQVIDFMRTTEIQVDELFSQIIWMTRALPFSNNPF